MITFDSQQKYNAYLLADNLIDKYYFIDFTGFDLTLFVIIISDQQTLLKVYVDMKGVEPLTTKFGLTS